MSSEEDTLEVEGGGQRLDCNLGLSYGRFDILFGTKEYDDSGEEEYDGVFEDRGKAVNIDEGKAITKANWTEGRERLRGSRRFDELAAADSQQRAFSGGERRARAGQDAERSERSGRGGQGRARYCHLRGQEIGGVVGAVEPGQKALLLSGGRGGREDMPRLNPD
ncbi:hypothetical protein JRO89_XS13G0216200 [Xanthoceras sorbifolium]|uniref:Uncharacterized protein n=1 Tax=Xanthoceras sorbifolium TaxID=99658 RepID=A0ABQ8H9F3_9ROSI|nr:hypothetical protein JRO89_XS13G0216200 [Xanthoceras sorbifolium]